MKKEKEIKRTTVRIDEKLLEKLRYIATQENRSVNAQINLYIQAYLMEFEQEHGEIKKADV